ncbi:hypothetical protein IAI10_16280 [Clostridium sp. 19966]|uniref:hypothetical protein n=1 Tax=Clostridium sp. 19966 TaxID=2768166 RepID=UPI0028E0999F|nr:hypothetical protein [Clostridium sp. 19966]MDT8718225.1 hypothetical protein [Clostridium sp. 19966]
MLGRSNKYNGREKQIKNSFWKGAAVTSIPAIVVIVVFYQVFFIPIAKKNTEDQILNENKEQKQVVYILNKPVIAGNPVESSDFTPVPNNKEAVPDNALKDVRTEALKGMVYKINLNKKTSITSAMIVKQEDYAANDIRNQDYSDIALSKNLKVGDYIDIRYKAKDGSDYVVVAKKKVLSINAQTLIINISEQERQYKNNATVAASLTGGILYTTIYIDPQNQEAAKVTYELNDTIKKMITSNPNVVNSAEKDLKDKNASTVTTDKPNFAN